MPPSGQMQAPLAAEHANLERRAVDIPRVARDGDLFLHRLGLRAPRPDDLLRYDELHLLLATYATQPALARAEVELRGTTCSYFAEPTATVRDNRELGFVRGKGCLAMRGIPDGRLDLKIWLRNEAGLAAWVFVAKNQFALPGYLYIPVLLLVDGPRTPWLILRGSVRRTPPRHSYSRADLLAIMWQLPGGGRSVLRIVGFAGALCLGGALLILARPDAGRRAWLGPVALDAAGTALVAAGLATAYAVVLPPLQGPDEPSHVLSYGRLVAAIDGRVELEEWARRTHFARLRFQTHERFTAVDAFAPLRTILPYDIGVVPTAQRSPLTAAVWIAAAPWLDERPLPQRVLALRLVHAALFAFAVGAATAIIAAAAGPVTGLSGLFYLAIPTLPFFATIVSDTAILIGVDILLAAAVIVVLLAGARRWQSGLLLGLCAAGLLCNADAAWPLLAILPPLIMFGALEARTLRQSLSFFAALAAGVGGVLLIVDRSAQLMRILALAPEQLRETVRATDWRAAVAAGLLLPGIDRLIGWISVRLAPRAQSVRRVLVSAWVIVALAAGGSFLGSLFITYPDLPLLASRGGPESASDYVSAVSAHMATALRLTPPDHLLVASFWGGFGWIDTVPPWPLISLFVVALAILGLRLFWLIAIHADGARAIRLLSIGIGLGLTLGGYAFGAYVFEKTNIHGRYLTGWWLVVVGTAWTALLYPGAGANRPRSGPRAVAVAMTFIGVVHAYCLSFIAARYF